MSTTAYPCMLTTNKYVSKKKDHIILLIKTIVFYETLVSVNGYDLFHQTTV